MNLTNLTNMPNPTSENLSAHSLSAFSQQIATLFSFIEGRKQLRQQLQNSLSNKKPIINNTTNEENQLYSQLITALAEVINEGHTILTVDNRLLPDQLLDHWQQQQRIFLLSPTQLTSENVTKAMTSARPIILQRLVDRSVIWLYRQWFAERQLAEQLMAIAKRPMPKLSLHTSNTAVQPNPQQQLAIEKASQNALCIITGGPGTGKTFTVAQLVIALYTAHESQKRTEPHLAPLAISLTAPTGKAAQRMQESLSKSLVDSLQGKSIAIDNAKTLHRLLGIGSNGVPRYNRDNPLPDDLIIVDEASMLGLELAGLLVDAIKPTARLILLGDANQLAAVDAGAVLSDLCVIPALAPYRVALSESKRFDDNSPIGQLALAITQVVTTPEQQQQKLIKTLSLLPKFNFNNEKNVQKRPNTLSDIRFFPIYKNTDLRQVYDELADLYQPYFSLMQSWQTQTPDITNPTVRTQLFTIFDSFRVLSAGHHGNLGVKMLNQMLSRKYKKQAKLPLSDSRFFHGQPIMMLKNDYQLGLFNGDIGICIQLASLDSQGNTVLGEMVVCFPEKIVPISRISQDSCDTAFAFTIHKSQGSEFDHVAVCLDISHVRLLSQELIYTAITRSKGKLSLFCPEMTLKMAILQKGNRQTGLVLQFD